MFNRKIIYRKPTFPRNFGKKKRRRKNRDYGAIFEAAFVLILFILFLWIVFRTPANAEAVACDTIPGGRKIYYQSEFNDDSRAARLYFQINEARTAKGLPELVFDYELADKAMARIYALSEYQNGVALEKCFSAVGIASYVDDFGICWYGVEFR